MRYRSGVRVWLIRTGIVLCLAVLGYALHALLAPRGLAWVVWALGGCALAFVVLELVLRARRRAGRAGDEERWRATIDDPRARRTAITEVRSRFERARRLGPRLRVEQARLATLLAELLLADDKTEAALGVLAKVPLDELAPIEAAVVRHARAQAYLAAGDLDGADTTLRPLPEQAGDEVLDASIALCRGAIALGRGELDRAEEIARAIIEESDDELRGEARALLAACLHARGDREGASVLVRQIDAEQRRHLSLLGPAVLREVLAA